MSTKKINYLDDRSKVRNKIGIWLGSNTHQAVTHTVKELTSNSCDLISEGDGDTIIWTLHDKNTIEIFDNCSGLPLEGTTIIKETDIRGNVKETEKANYELLLMTMFAGTKHNGLETGLSTTGTNGLFLTLLTYCSEFVEYEVGRPNGKIYHCSFENGFIKDEFGIIGKTDKTYTKIKYKLSDEVFTDNYFDFEEVCDICLKQSSLINGNIKVIDKVNNKEKEFHFENGIEELLEILNTKEKSCENIIIEGSQVQPVQFENKDYTDNVSFKLVFNYVKDEENNINIDFLNRSELIHHGTIYDGIIDGLKKSFHDFIKNQGLYTKNEKTNISKEDVLCGLNYIINFNSQHPNMYSNQTKFESKITYYKTITTSIIVKYFEIFAIENKDKMIQLVNKILLNKRSREKAEVSRSDARKALEEKIENASNRPPKFVPCRSKNPSEIDFVLIEGDSSLNSVKLARDSSCTCILPLKGKPINPFKAKLDELLNNQEIRSIFKILGCGVTYKGKAIKGMPVFNINNLLVDKVLIATDFDNDGFHIQALLIGIFYVLSPKLLESGKIHILYTPLYVIKTKKKVNYKGEETNELLAYSETERNTIVKMLNDNNISFKEVRFKGLGGLPTSIMSKCLNKDTRILKQIQLEDIEESKKWLELLLTDEKLKERKEFIETQGKNYFDYSLFE